nr:hypothetical protein Iba_chr13fCG4070 [Ipomoea batatas]
MSHFALRRGSSRPRRTPHTLRKRRPPHGVWLAPQSEARLKARLGNAFLNLDITIQHLFTYSKYLYTLSYIFSQLLLS